MVHTAFPPRNRASQPLPNTSPDTSPNSLSVKFWGVRGSVPTPTAANQRYGGNTVCVEALIGDQRIIFDGGTGLVGLGHHLQQTPCRAHLFFTHTQWDRIQGFPFFQPAFIPQNHFSIYGGTAPNGASIKHCLTDQMLQPHFTMPLQHMRADLSFHTLSDRDSFQISDIQVDTLKINHRTEALGYRLTWQGHSLVYATDTPTEQIDPELLKFADQADLLIYDGTYSDLTYLYETDTAKAATQPWDIGIEIAEKAHVKELALLHHSPVQDDATLDLLQTTVSDRFPTAKIAYEGMVLHQRCQDHKCQEPVL